jgi:hypothetical protein
MTKYHVMPWRFRYGLLPKPEDNEMFTPKTTLCDEHASHIPGNVSRNNVRISRRNNPHAVIEGGKRDNPKFNLCSLYPRKGHRAFFICENTVIAAGF